MLLVVLVGNSGRRPGFADALSAAKELIASHYLNEMLPQACPEWFPYPSRPKWMSTAVGVGEACYVRG
jgi:hypothetical protein